MHYKKFLKLILPFCLICCLTACGTPELPEESDITTALSEHYFQKLCKVESIETVDESIDSDTGLAYRTCVISASDSSNTYKVYDTWDIYYILQDKTIWELSDMTLTSSECELLADISEAECFTLLDDILPETGNISSINTDLESCTATASFSYLVNDPSFGDLGELMIDATGTANFSWNIEDGWILESTEKKQQCVYNMAFNLYEEADALTSEKFWLKMNVSIIDNIPFVEIVDYQGSIDTLGNLTLSNVQLLTDNDAPETVQIVFDYMRDIENIENDERYSDLYAGLDAYYGTEGAGTITIEGENSASIYFDHWTLNGWTNKWEKYLDFVSVSPGSFTED